MLLKQTKKPNCIHLTFPLLLWHFSRPALGATYGLLFLPSSELLEGRDPAGSQRANTTHSSHLKNLTEFNSKTAPDACRQSF